MLKTSQEPKRYQNRSASESNLVRYLVYCLNAYKKIIYETYEFQMNSRHFF